MKTMRLFFIFGLMVALLAVAPNASAALFTYTSGFQVQNLEADTAHLTVYFYLQNGTQPAGTPISQTIAANGSYTFYPLTVAAGFNGSVVVASDNQVAAITNVLNTTGYANASYLASATGSVNNSVPLLFRNHGSAHWYTWLNAQNTGGSAATITVNYTDGSTASSPAAVQPGASYTFDQSTETHTATVFAGTVTSAQPVAVSVIQEKSANVMMAYSGFATTPPTLPVLPLINYNPSKGWSTGVQIYNSGGASTDVTVSYTPAPPPGGAGTACTETQTIPSADSRTFALTAFATGASSTCTAGAKFIGSARVTTNSASMPLSVVVNQVTTVKGGAYNGFNASTATSKVVFPLIMDRNGPGLWFTGFNLMNVGTGNTTVTCTFTGACSGRTISQLLTPGQALNDIQNGVCAANYAGAATCTAAPAQPIVGVCNENRDGAYDYFMVYEGANATP